ncbi:MAG TPA: helix-turn-helix transcriptional regulator [Pseudonocardiaceae bacterium]|nr:helix-turn-helix transcriptional regulator [Pseudonocardiaceae bacterium]
MNVRSTDGARCDLADGSVVRMDDPAVDAILTGACTMLRTARLEREWRLADLARNWGVSQSVLCRLELARREPSLRQMIEVYGLLSMRFSGVLRMAEDQAFPLGGAPWGTDGPVGLLGEFR